MRIVLLAGEIGSGKTTIAAALAERYSGRHVKVREALAAAVGCSPNDRAALQVLGAELDRRTRGEWMIGVLEEWSADSLLVVDAMRTVRQTRAVRRFVPTELLFLEASAATRFSRYNEAALAGDEMKRRVPFQQATNHETEREARLVRRQADVVLLTDELDIKETVNEAARLLG